MRGNFTLRNLLRACLITLFHVTTLHAVSQNNNPTTCTTSAGTVCGEVDETFNITNGDFSSPANNFTWTNDFNNWRANLTANSTYTLTSGLYTVGNTTTANIGFAIAGIGGNDISSYTINIRNVTGALLATCSGTFTTTPPDGTTICRTLDDLDIQNQTVRVEFVFTASATTPAGEELIFNDFRTNFTAIPACNVTSTVCPVGVTEDFDDGNRGDFTTSANGFVYNPGTGGDGFFELPTFSSPTYSNRTFTLTSGRYQLAATAFTVTTGFNYTGGLSNDVESLIVNLRDDANNVLSSCTFIRGVNEFAEQICLTLNSANLAGRAVRVEFIFDMDDNAGGELQFDDFRINLPSAAPLPVDFITFDARKAHNGVQLLWTVGTEINVDRYEVERSSDGVSFTKIGAVPAIGSSSYNFTDAQPLSGTSYYRVRNVDHDGQFAYTTVVKYKNGQAELLSKVFPTTTRGQVTLQHAPVSGKALITITNLEGRILRNLTPVRGAMSTPIDLSAYATGTYLLRYVREDGQTETFKIIKQ